MATTLDRDGIARRRSSAGGIREVSAHRTGRGVHAHVDGANADLGRWYLRIGECGRPAVEARVVVVVWVGVGGTVGATRRPGRGRIGSRELPVVVRRPVVAVANRPPCPAFTWFTEPCCVEKELNLRGS